MYYVIVCVCIKINTCICIYIYVYTYIYIYIVYIVFQRGSYCRPLQVDVYVSLPLVLPGIHSVQ